MKRQFISLPILLVLSLKAQAQGTFQYDQQSYTAPIPPNGLLDIQGYEPVGQSFVPSLPTVGFVQFELFDGHPNNGLGATLYVNVRSNSISGPIIGSSNPVYMPETPSGGGLTNFFFSTPVAVIPGMTFFFDIRVQSGDLWLVNSTGGNPYPAGNTYVQAISQSPSIDLWFREGVIIPEPSAIAVFSLAAAAFSFIRRK